jgi:restriction system protein
MQFPEFAELQNQPSQSVIQQNGHDEEATQTPEELLEANYQNLRQDLAQELLERILGCSSQIFETLVVDLLVAMG